MFHRPGRRTLTLIGAAAGALVVATFAVPVLAGQPDAPEPVVTEQAAPKCAPGQRDLAQADDRFDQGCIAGQDIARLDDSDATLGENRVASRRMSLVANLPQGGRVRRATAHSTPTSPSRASTPTPATTTASRSTT